MDYELKVERQALHLREDLSPLEVRYALALADGVNPKQLKGAARTLTRAIAGLKKKGVIMEKVVKVVKEKTPADKWLGDSIQPLTSRDGFQAFERFGLAELTQMSMTDRFALFCRLYGADGNDAATRKAWTSLEQREGKYIAEIMPQILQAAQHQRRWVEVDLADTVDADKWLDACCYNNAMYNVRAGEDPGQPDSPELWRERANRAAEELRNMGEDFVTPSGDEIPKQAAKRLEAVIRSVKKFRGMQ
jgi:hypothetical protein